MLEAGLLLMELYTKEGQTLLESGGITHYIPMEMNVIVESRDVLRRVETYISGPVLEKRWLELTGKKEPLQSIVQDLSDEKAKQWKEEFLENFGIGLANVIDILDPDIIVLGGGASNIPFLYDEGKKAVYDKVFSDSIETPIIKNSLGDSAGVFGACLLKS